MLRMTEVLQYQRVTRRIIVAISTTQQRKLQIPDLVLFYDLVLVIRSMNERNPGRLNRFGSRKIS